MRKTIRGSSRSMDAARMTVSRPWTRPTLPAKVTTKLSPAARYDLMENVAAHYRETLAVEEDQISGENFVRDLTALLYTK